MTNGVLMYAHNNLEIDYLKIACANALMIQKNLHVPISLITDISTYNWGKKSLTEKFIEKCFDKIIFIDKNHRFINERNFNDTSFTTKNLQFYNCNHWKAYELTPYDETLFIDCDYLIMSSSLNNCWGSRNDVMINHTIYSPYDQILPYSKTVDDMGIKQYWATVIYFRKSPLAKHLFSLVQHIQKNYSYYKDLYYFSSGLYRNDHAFSVAIHMLNGFNDFESIITELPILGLLMSWDVNDIHSVKLNDIILYVERSESKGNYILSRIKDTDVHIMNKWAINRHSDELIKLYE